MLKRLLTPLTSEATDREGKMLPLYLFPRALKPLLNSRKPKPVYKSTNATSPLEGIFCMRDYSALPTSSLVFHNNWMIKDWLRCRFHLPLFQSDLRLHCSKAVGSTGFHEISWPRCYLQVLSSDRQPISSQSFLLSFIWRRLSMPVVESWHGMKKKHETVV